MRFDKILAVLVPFILIMGQLETSAAVQLNVNPSQVVGGTTVANMRYGIGQSDWDQTIPTYRNVTLGSMTPDAMLLQVTQRQQRHWPA